MPAHDSFKDFVSDVIGEAEDFIRPVTDPIREGLAKVTPKELKPYITSAISLALGAPPGAVGGGFQGFLGRMIGGGLQDAFIQKLFTDPDDEDTDVDLLRAGTTGLFRGLQGLDPAKTLVSQDQFQGNPNYGNIDPKTGAMDNRRFLPTSKENIDIVNQMNLEANQLAAGQITPDQVTLEPLRVSSISSDDLGMRNFLQSDAPRALRDFATPFQFDQTGGGVMGALDAVGEATIPLQAVNVPSQTRDAAKALEESERRYQNYLDTLEADQRASVEADMNERIAAHKEYMTLAGFTNAEIDDALIAAGYIASGETAFARGGRVGFDMGGDTGGKTDRMGLGNYIEAEKVRTEFTDKMKRGLQAAQMNMKLNDPGLMRFVNALVPGGEGFYTREEMRFPSMKERYEMNIEKMTRDQARDDFEKKKIENELRKELFDNVVDMIDDRFSDNREQRKMANKGGRMTPEGDPISPDVPKGMQMDLRGGGFIPLGTKPKADDVPAMVGLNEFVLNDEAVSGIGKMLTGKPDPRAGARALYQLQDQMEAIV